jgi:hypothetical protein
MPSSTREHFTSAASAKLLSDDTAFHHRRIKRR